MVEQPAHNRRTKVRFLLRACQWFKGTWRIIMNDFFLSSKTIKIVFSCGTIYITIDDDDDKQPFRVIIRKGKCGVCQGSLLQAIGRLATIIIQEGIPIERISHTLKGIICDSSAYPNKSCVDSLAKQLEKYNPHNTPEKNK